MTFGVEKLHNDVKMFPVLPSHNFSVKTVVRIIKVLFLHVGENRKELQARQRFSPEVGAL